ncbi:MAG: hypothetical protein IJ003_01830 [Candidatus Gastranaerophilales bacterium]|nr:hypothetical protein [Candidatus Gastranaerophilales bacterium]
MNIEVFIELEFQNKIYSLDLEKLHFILSKLANKKITTKNTKEILELMKYYHLLNEDFLENINKI